MEVSREDGTLKTSGRDINPQSPAQAFASFLELAQSQSVDSYFAGSASPISPHEMEALLRPFLIEPRYAKHVMSMVVGQVSQLYLLSLGKSIPVAKIPIFGRMIANFQKGIIDRNKEKLREALALMQEELEREMAVPEMECHCGQLELSGVAARFENLPRNMFNLAVKGGLSPLAVAAPPNAQSVELQLEGVQDGVELYCVGPESRFMTVNKSVTSKSDGTVKFSQSGNAKLTVKVEGFPLGAELGGQAASEQGRSEGQQVTETYTEAYPEVLSQVIGSRAHWTFFNRGGATDLFNLSLTAQIMVPVACSEIRGNLEITTDWELFGKRKKTLPILLKVFHGDESAG